MNSLLQIILTLFTFLLILLLKIVDLKQSVHLSIEIGDFIGFS